MQKREMLTDAEFLHELESLLDCVSRARVMIRQMQQDFCTATTHDLVAEERRKLHKH